MKALVVEKPGKLKVMDLTEPEMGEYEAKCEMLYGATCAGTDLAVVDGKFAWPVEYPCIIGHEGIGRVVAVGTKVRNYKIGDLVARVYSKPTDGVQLAWGGMAEIGMAVDWKAMWADGIDRSEWDYFRVNQVIPEGVIDPLDAVMVITWRENMSWVKRMDVGKGNKVLVVGSGANGISIAACAAILGGEVTVIGNSSRRENTMKTGVQAYIDYKDHAVVSEFIEKNSANYTFIIDATGQKEALTPYMTMLMEGGTVAVYGMNDFHTYTFNPIRGPKTFRFYNSYAGIYDEAETHEEIIDLIRAGKLDAANWIDKDNIFTWENAPDAYEHVRNKKAVKSVIKLSRS